MQALCGLQRFFPYSTVKLPTALLGMQALVTGVTGA